MGRKQYLAMSYKAFNEVIVLMPTARFVDVSRMASETRLFKSCRELEYLLKSPRLNARNQLETAKHVVARMTKHEFARILRIEQLGNSSESLTLFSVRHPEASPA